MNWRVDIPVPKPGADDVTNKGTELGNWLAQSGSSVFIIILCLVGALVVMSMLKRPFVRGLLVGAIILFFLIMAFK